MYTWFFIFAFTTSLFLTWLIKRIALYFNIVDSPDQERKKHLQATPLLGGVAIFISLAITLYLGREIILAGNLETHHWLGVLIGSIFLMIGGLIDDIKKLPPRLQLIFPLLAAISVVISGVGIEKITNPAGGFFFFDTWQIPVLNWNSQTYYFNIVADTFTILWLLGMTYTTKLLDGIDGLVGSITVIGSLVIFLFTTTTRWEQPDIAFAALILAAACLGFLLLNWHPAKIFLGEGGSLFLGFMLGVLSIISGGKIAIALLIMGLPVLDVVWTIFRRLLNRQSPFQADRHHLHFRLFDAGLGPKKTVLILCSISLLFGASGLFLQSQGKIYSLIGLFALMLIFLATFRWLDKRGSIG